MILPHVSALCLADIVSQAKADDVAAAATATAAASASSSSTTPAAADDDDAADNAEQEEEEGTTGITTSPHVVSVESEHPYRPATVSHYR